MKTKTSANRIELHGELLAINNGDNGQYSCFTEILRSTYGQLQAMLSHHSRVLVIRFDLHLGRHYPDNKALSRFMERIKRRLILHYKMTRVGYVWVREQERAKQQHYHVALFLDGSKIRHPSRLLEWIDERWQARQHPKVYIPKNCYYMLHRHDQEGQAEAIYRLSYLAKTRGKGYRGCSVNDYSTSRLKSVDC